MSLTQQQKMDAAEYVLGTLSLEERRAFEAELATDPNLAGEIREWEALLAGLALTVPGMAAPEHVWRHVDTALSHGGHTPGAASPDIRAANDNMHAVERSRGRWRFAAIAAGLFAVAFGLLYFAERSSSFLQPGTQEYIAVVNASGDQPALVVSVNAATGDVTIRSLGVDRPPDRSLELWYVEAGGKPVSVGLVGEGDIDLGDLSAKPGDLLAVSLEPKGGSPTGVATGPVIYTGTLIPDPVE